MSKPKQIIIVGDKFGYLTVRELVRIQTSEKHTHPGAVCDCSCGQITKPIRTGDLALGKVKSCGCHRREVTKERQTTHGHWANRKPSTEYGTWRRIVECCTNPKNDHYHIYGGRGITVCDRWRNSFENFLSDVGYRPDPKYELDRIDNDGNYEPGNVRWVPKQINQRNKRTNHYLTLPDGSVVTLAEAAEIYEIAYHTLKSRIYRGWSVEKALITPVKK